MSFFDEPIEHKPFPWKMGLIIFSGVVIAGVVIGAVVWRNQTSVQTTSVSSVGMQAKSISLKDTTQTISDAVEKKDERACDVLKGVEKDDCLWSVARVKQNPDACKNLSDQVLASSCYDDVASQTAIMSAETSGCDKIDNELKKRACQRVVQRDPQIKTCIDASCLASRVLTAATLAQDADLCEVLSPKESADCRARVPFDDADHDGLETVHEKIIYLTDPHNPDTDGDGYKDGDEVKSGHDPLRK